jgi:hypothetical protein
VNRNQIAFRNKKNQVKRELHLIANQIAKMANPKPVANKGKEKCNWNWQIKLPKWQIAN